jgi:hypothetical protein
MFQMTLHQDIFIGRAVIHHLMLHHRGRQVMSRGHLTYRVALHRRPTTLDPLRLEQSKFADTTSHRRQRARRPAGRG